MQVLAQQRPWLHKVLDYEEELFAVVCAALDRQALAASSATFADGLYGLRRMSRPSAASSVKDPHLSHRQQRSTVMLTVCSPTQLAQDGAACQVLSVRQLNAG